MPMPFTEIRGSCSLINTVNWIVPSAPRDTEQCVLEHRRQPGLAAVTSVASTQWVSIRLLRAQHRCSDQ